MRVQRQQPGRRWAWRSGTGFLIAIVVALCVVGCVETPRRHWYSGECIGGSSCGDEGLCIDGLCAQSCATQADCDEGICIKKHCVPDAKFCAYVDCADGNECSDDLCDDKLLQCKHVLHEGPCADDQACTVGEECHLVGEVPTCVVSAAKCDDGDDNTIDSCNAAGECTNTPK